MMVVVHVGLRTRYMVMVVVVMAVDVVREFIARCVFAMLVVMVVYVGLLGRDFSARGVLVVVTVVVVVHVRFRARNMVVMVMSVVVSVGLSYFCLHCGSWVSSDHSPGFNRNNLISGLVLLPDKK